MTGTLRSTARNPVAVALMGLLILVFAVIGIGGNGRFPELFRQVRADSVVSAGGHSMSATDYRKVFEQQKQRFEEQSKQTVTNGFLVQNGFDQQLLNAIAQDEALTEVLARIGVDPGPRLIDDQIKKLPFAFDRVTGKFSEAQFTQFLAAQGLTVAQAQAQLSDDLAQRHFLYAVQAGFNPPRIFAAMNAVAGLENRDVSYFILDPKTVPQPAAPTDAQLAAFLKAHAAQLMRPEMRVVDVVKFSAAALAPTVTVDAAAVQKEFEFRKDSLSTSETRSLVQIPVKSAAQGSDAAARLARGEDPGAIARSYGVQPIVYADKPIGAVADRKLAALVFSLPAGATKGPVQGDLGLAAVKVEKVTPAKAATLESARPKIEADLKQKAARDKAYQQSQAFDDAPQRRREPSGRRRQGRRSGADHRPLRRERPGRARQARDRAERPHDQIGLRQARRGRRRPGGRRGRRVLRDQAGEDRPAVVADPGRGAPRPDPRLPDPALHSGSEGQGQRAGGPAQVRRGRSTGSPHRSAPRWSGSWACSASRPPNTKPWARASSRACSA